MPALRRIVAETLDGPLWVLGRSIRGEGEFQHLRDSQPPDQEPGLGAPDPRGQAQTDQMETEALLDKARHLR
jgi:Mn-containing catalase